MRRLVAILLLVVLSVQFSWAAAASYCEHDKDTTTQHLGHHEHDHGQATAEADEPANAPDQAPGAHADCASCHLSAAKTFSSLEMPVPPVAGSCAPKPTTDTPRSSHLFERIERPKWHRA